MSIKVSTKVKLLAGRILYYSVRVLNALRGVTSTQIRCTRGGILWELELREGIDLSIFCFGRFERDTSKALERIIKPGMVVVDIGANIGAHTLPIAKHVGETGRVFAIEPTSFAYSKLSRNIDLNPSLKSRIVTVNAAFVSDTSQELGKIYASWRLTGTDNAHSVHGGVECDTSQAQRVTFDSFVAQAQIKKISVIKLDVDGFETHVLKGGLEALRRDHPTIVMEFSPYVHKEHGATFDEVVNILTDLGYGFECERTGKPLPSDVKELEAIIPAGGGINVIARPDIS
jgi:FkbM family methyltransferase